MSQMGQVQTNALQKWPLGSITEIGGKPQRSPFPCNQPRDRLSPISRGDQGCDGGSSSRDCADLIRRRVAVIVATGTPETLAANFSAPPDILGGGYHWPQTPSLDRETIDRICSVRNFSELGERKVTGVACCSAGEPVHRPLQHSRKRPRLHRSAWPRESLAPVC